MTDFERELVHAFNNFFENETINGIAHRKKKNIVFFLTAL